MTAATMATNRRRKTSPVRRKSPSPSFNRLLPPTRLPPILLPPLVQAISLSTTDMHSFACRRAVPFRTSWTTSPSRRRSRQPLPRISLPWLSPTQSTRSTKTWTLSWPKRRTALRSSRFRSPPSFTYARIRPHPVAGRIRMLLSAGRRQTPPFTQTSHMWPRALLFGARPRRTSPRAHPRVKPLAAAPSACRPRAATRPKRPTGRAAVGSGLTSYSSAQLSRRK